jgi:protein-tyrosine phosphatase
MIHWVPTGTPGRLGIMAHPLGAEHLAREVRSLRARGVHVVVSLLEADEAAALGLDGEAAACAAEGLGFLAHPVRDHGVPDGATRLPELLDALEAALAAGRTVAVHCRAGVGRSGLVAVLVLVRLGLDVEVARSVASSARGRDLPETPEQLAWLLEAEG